MQETTDETIRFPFKCFFYKIEKSKDGNWRALYSECHNSSWKPVKIDFDWGFYERTYIFKRSAEKACRKHAAKRRQEYDDLNSPPTYLGCL